MPEIVSVVAIMALSLCGLPSQLWKEAKHLCKKGQGKNRDADSLDLAIRMCQASRVAHIRIWVSAVPREAVRQLKAILTLQADWIETVPGAERYAKNVRTRIRSLNNLLKGKSPVVPKDAFPEEKDLIRKVKERLAAMPKWHSNCAKTLKTRKRRLSA